MRRLGGVSSLSVGKGFRSTAYPGMSTSKIKSLSLTSLPNMSLHYTTTNCGSRKRPSSELLLPVGCKKTKNITTNMLGIKPANILSKHKNETKPETSNNTCRGCHRIFFNRARLEQHKKDTGHRPNPISRVHCSVGSTVPSHRQPMIILKRRSDETIHYSPEKIRRTRAKEYLNDFHKRKIAINNSSKKDSVKLVDGTLRQIMKHVKNSKGGNIYCQNLVAAGSFKEKTKIGKADEFDTNIVCNIIPDDIRTRGTVDFEYQSLGKMMGKANNMNIKMRLKDIPGGKEIPKGYAVVKVKDGTVPAKLTHNGHLVPREVKQDLHGKIKNAVKELRMKNVDVSRNAHGPALTLIIHQDQGRHDISVDITPSIPCKEPLKNNEWPRPDTRKALSNRVVDDIKNAGTHLVPKGDNVWAISYSKAENAALSKIDKGNGCRREVNRIMKKHVQDCTSRSKDGLPGVSSHMIKHQVLWSAELHPDQKYWHHTNVDKCLYDTMGDMVSSLDRGNLPNYFNSCENLIQGKDRRVLRELSDHLKKERTQMLNM